MSLPLSLTSCSNDDDEEGGGSSSKITLKVDGQSADFGYVYWNIDKEQSQNGKKYYHSWSSGVSTSTTTRDRARCRCSI